MQPVIRIWVPLTRPLRLGPFFCFCIFSDQRSKQPHGGDTGSFLFYSIPLLFFFGLPTLNVSKGLAIPTLPLRIIITTLQARLRDVVLPIYPAGAWFKATVAGPRFSTALLLLSLPFRPAFPVCALALWTISVCLRLMSFRAAIVVYRVGLFSRLSHIALLYFLSSRLILFRVSDCVVSTNTKNPEGLFTESTHYLPENHTALANSPLPPIEFVQPSLISH
ncbi:unnamed protein product [Clonostachys solani]|uniref:Uncharacterized protein n=1 Tax=Clonostachys solani TaxID=160281 RepID=A0A9N9Z4Z7_9HYPO|nr:unnamed protein product [Clonostachys solani]